jgi:hypothetical protein
MLHFVSAGLHFRVSARFHTASDERIALARLVMSRSSSEGGASLPKSISNSIALSEIAEREIGNHPSSLLRTPAPPGWISISIVTTSSEYFMFPAQTAMGSESLRHLPVVMAFAVLIVTVGYSPPSRPQEPFHAPSSGLNLHTCSFAVEPACVAGDVT